MDTKLGPDWEQYLTPEDGESFDATLATAIMPANRGLVLDTPMDADWALRQARDYQRRIDETNSQADDYIARVEFARKSVIEKLADKLAFFETLLHSWAMKWTGEHPHEGKTIPLPHGTLSLRAQQPEIHRDNDEILAWLRANNLGRFIKEKTTYTVDWAGLKKLCDLTGDDVVFMPTGEVVPGTQMEYRPEKFEMKFGVPEVTEIEVPALPEHVEE